MSVGRKSRNPMHSMRWIGVVVAAMGAVLMLNSGPLSGVWIRAHLPTSFPVVHLDWLLLIGMVAIIGGGVLVQTTWRNHHG